MYYFVCARVLTWEGVQFRYTLCYGHGNGSKEYLRWLCK